MITVSFERLEDASNCCMALAIAIFCGWRTFRPGGEEWEGGLASCSWATVPWVMWGEVGCVPRNPKGVILVVCLLLAIALAALSMGLRQVDSLLLG